MVLQSLFSNTPVFLQELLGGVVPEELHTTVAMGATVFTVPLAFWLVLRALTTTKQDGNERLADGSVHLPPTLPSTLPILGNLLDILPHRHHRHDWFTTQCENHGGQPFQLQIIGRPATTLICSVQGMEDVLKTHFEQLPKGPNVNQVFRDLLGHGIFAVDGAQWVHQRKTASNMFSARALRDTMTESMRRYAAVLQRILQKHHDEGTSVDVFKLMNKFTIEAFAKIGFGIDMNCLEAEQDHPFQHAFDSSQRVLASRFQRPTWLWKFRRLFNIGPEAQLKKDIAVIDSTVTKIIAESLANRQSGEQKESADIVSLFLDRFDGASSDGEAFDSKYLRDIVVNFLIAGRDTTAQAMSWCFFNLSKQPEIVTKIRQELASVVPDFVDGKDTTPPTMEQVQQLTYLDAVLKETLRLHPSVPLIPKSVVEDTVLSDGTLLQKGTLVLLMVYAMGRMPFVWGEDAKLFKPERWIDSETGKLRNISPYQFVSFHAGPRLCLGMNLAMLEMKVVLASVLGRFNLELLEGQEITYDNSLTLAVRGAMMARVTEARC